MSDDSLPIQFEMVNPPTFTAEQTHPGAKQSTGDLLTAEREIGVSVQAAENLRLISDELEALNSEIQRGEPLTPKSNTVRGRIARAFKGLLYRLLWWHSYQIKTVTDCIWY